jgi:hypothetical protein
MSIILFFVSTSVFTLNVLSRSVVKFPGIIPPPSQDVGIGH